MSLYWHTCGEGKRDLVLLHGWGLNAEVWRGILTRLRPHFRLHLVDLPGYGRSRDIPAFTLPALCEALLPRLPEGSLVLGWSLGGLVATQLALQAPQRLQGLITVAASPCFAAQENWPGIRPSVLTGFKHQLSQHFEKTVERFMALQTLGTPSARQDAVALREAVLTQPLPEVRVLNAGLSLLQNTDFRPRLAEISVPSLRIYGALDALVPRDIVPRVDTLSGNGHSVVIPKAGHAPFISHPDFFSQILTDFSQI